MRAATTSTVIDWPTEAASQVLLLTADDLPSKPFQLAPNRLVVNPGQWLESLQADVRRGPEGLRWRSGIVARDVNQLREYIAGQ